jgi:hypothetical protein
MASGTAHAPGSYPCATRLPPIAYEREPGAASSAPCFSYQRREPQKTVLYRVVLDNVETLFEEARRGGEDGSGYPKFVQKAMRHYLSCGLLPGGFIRLKCPGCGYERVLAFSCKSNFCPSCRARRAADIAAHLVDRVLPEAPYRQFVLTFPWAMRLPLAFDPSFLSRTMNAYLKTLFAWQRLRGRLAGIRAGRTGAVTFIQRFGGALNLAPHFHSLLPDGLFVPGPEGRLAFAPLPPPSDQEIAELTARIASRLIALAQALIPGFQEAASSLDKEQVLLGQTMGEALRPPLPAQTFFETFAAEPTAKPLCARVEGFSLHAARTVAADDREGLEQLARYGLRAPFSLQRLSLLPDGNVCYHLRRPWPTPDGASTLILDPLAFLRRLVALIPRPFQNLLRYHGVFANRSKDRFLLPPPPASQPSTDSPASTTVETPPCTPPPPPVRPRSLGWAQLLRRVCHVDALLCPRCGASLVVLAFITDPAVIKKILDHIRIPSTLPIPAPPRRPLEPEFIFCDEPPVDDRQDEASAPSYPVSSRSPP